MTVELHDSEVKNVTQGCDTTIMIINWQPTWAMWPCKGLHLVY